MNAPTLISRTFAMVGVWFGVIEKMGNTADNLVTVAEEASGAYRDQSRVDRQRKALAAAKLLEAETVKP